MRRYVWLGLLLTALGATVAVIAVVLAVGVLERPFPGFAVYPNHHVALSVGLEAQPGRPATMDKIEEIGGHPLAPGETAYDAARAAPGEVLRYGVRQIERPFRLSPEEGRRYESFVRVRAFSALEFLASFGALYLTGVTFLVIGAVAFFTKPRANSFSLLVFCVAAGTTLMTTFDAFTTHVFARGWYELFNWMIPPAVLSLSIHFPRESRGVARYGWLRWAPFLLVPVPFLFGLRFFGEGTGWLTPHLANIACIDAASLYFFARLLWQQRRSEAPIVRQRAKVLLLGSAFGFVPPSLILLASVWLGVEPPGGYLLIVGLLLVPLTFAYAILRHDLLSVHVVVRRGLFYVALLSLAAVLYFVLLSALSLLASRTAVARSPLFPLLFAGMVVLLTEPVRRALWRYADRIYFRRGYDYRNTLRAASEEMAKLRDPDEVIAKLRTTAEEALEPERAEVLLYEAPPKDALALAAARSQVALYATEREEEAGEEDAALAQLQARGARLAVPLGAEGGLLGLLLLGQKKSGALYTSEDLSLLRTLANQSAVALENARRFRVIEEMNASLEEKVRARTRDLEEARAFLVQSEKMAALGRLIAGVAHELNNPANVIGHATEALQETAHKAYHFARLAQERPSLAEDDRAFLAQEHKRQKLHRVPDDLKVMGDVLQSAGRRISSLVADLRNFSRGRVDEPREADLNEEIERALRMLAPRLGKIELNRALAPEARLRCLPDALGQVLLNLLTNAVDAVHEEGRIRVATERAAPGLVITVEDSGPGIPAEVLPHIFEPFYTTKDPGKGTGLGLWISYQIVERHGGTLHAENLPGGGARFRVSLPPFLG